MDDPYDFNHHKTFHHKGHDRIISFFEKYEFGSNNPVLTLFSILDPVDRCVVLERLIDPYDFDPVLSDKLLLAYISKGEKELASKVVANAARLEADPVHIIGLRSKLDLGLAPKRGRDERVEIYNGFRPMVRNDEELEFLNLMIDFCNEYYQ